MRKTLLTVTLAVLMCVTFAYANPTARLAVVPNASATIDVADTVFVHSEPCTSCHGQSMLTDDSRDNGNATTAKINNGTVWNGIVKKTPAGNFVIELSTTAFSEEQYGSDAANNETSKATVPFNGVSNMDQATWASTQRVSSLSLNRTITGSNSPWAVSTFGASISRISSLRIASMTRTVMNDSSANGNSDEMATSPINITRVTTGTSAPPSAKMN